jgi:DNA topoisomerase-2
LKDDETLIQDSDRDEDEMEFDNALPDRTVSGTDLIDMVFRKGRVEDRKNWLNAYTKDTFMDYSLAHESGVKYSDFINKELILFSKSDCQRSIPHVMDGFKPSQRKVLFSCFKRKLKDEIKVAQFAGYIGEHSAYHHGEASLHGTIINMAQTFCGSNNINLLTPSGQFGTRRMGGKDAASPRYIFTKLEKITRAIFHPDDDEVLNYLTDDGMSIEPEFYMPVIPMVLVNGSDGIGTGWSSSVNNYDPRAIVANIRRMINGEPLEAMFPFYSGFTGDVRIRPCDQHIIVFVHSKSNILFSCTDHPRGWRQVRSQGTN